MKPFLLLSTRAEDHLAHQEYDAFARLTGLGHARLHQVRLEREVSSGGVDLERYAGVFLGGSPFTISDPDEEKSANQRRCETELLRLVGTVVEQDFPFLGACFGVGTVGTVIGAEVDRRYGEPVGSVQVTLTAEGLADPLFGLLPPDFQAFVGHKEAISVLPDSTVLLAASAQCPVQAFRVGRNVYGTQFHPELDIAGICRRVEVYRHAGYFEASELDQVLARLRVARVEMPAKLLAAFAARYG